MQQAPDRSRRPRQESGRRSRRSSSSAPSNASARNRTSASSPQSRSRSCATTRRARRSSSTTPTRRRERTEIEGWMRQNCGASRQELTLIDHAVRAQQAAAAGTLIPSRAAATLVHHELEARRLLDGQARRRRALEHLVRDDAPPCASGRPADAPYEKSAPASASSLRCPATGNAQGIRDLEERCARRLKISDVPVRIAVHLLIGKAHHRGAQFGRHAATPPMTTVMPNLARGAA